MVYVSPDAKAFYLSKEALIQLKVIPRDFPKIGIAPAQHEVGGVDTADEEFEECVCRKRTLPPPKPNKLPFEATKDNVSKMKECEIEAKQSKFPFI